MKFIVDTQLPLSSPPYLKKEGHECIHTTDTEKGYLLEDHEIVAIAIASERSVITKDSDFKLNFLAKGAPSKVLYLTFGNISNKNLLA
jgi:predicted nuclease of predicted toxin-antitoxin system